MAAEIKEEILDENGNILFQVTKEGGRNYLYHKTNKIAECIYANYQEKFGDIHGWLKVVLKRENTRLEKITDTIRQLQQERLSRATLTEDIQKCAEQKK